MTILHLSDVKKLSVEMKLQHQAITITMPDVRTPPPQAVCMFGNFYLTFNFKSKVSCDVFKNKNECRLTSTFFSKILSQCHMPNSTCHCNA